MTDQEIVDMLHKAANTLNHALHVAHHRGLHVLITTSEDPVQRISDVYAARPLLPTLAAK